MQIGSGFVLMLSRDSDLLNKTTIEGDRTIRDKVLRVPDLAFYEFAIAPFFYLQVNARSHLLRSLNQNRRVTTYLEK